MEDRKGVFNGFTVQYAGMMQDQFRLEGTVQEKVPEGVGIIGQDFADKQALLLKQRFDVSNRFNTYVSVYMLMSLTYFSPNFSFSRMLFANRIYLDNIFSFELLFR